MFDKMKFLLPFILLAQGFIAFSQFESNSLAVHDVNLIDVNNGLIIENQTIIIQKGIITSILDSDQYRANDSAQTLDYKGYYVVPGLIDAHVHLGTNPSTNDNLEDTKERLEYLLKSGVTTVRDMAGDARYLGYLARQASLDEIQSPDIYYSALMAGESFFKDPRTRAASQGMPPGSAPWMRAISEDSEINTIISEAKGTGATGIKIYANLDKISIQKIVEAAHAKKMKVWAHSCVFPARPSEVSQAGVDVMSHATYMAWEGEKVIPLDASNRHRKHEQFNIKDPSFSNLIGIMKENEIILDATISVYKKYFPDSTLYQYGVSLTRLAYENDLKIGVGTDLPVTDLTGVVPIIQEMSALQEDVGMQPMDIIRGATIINAEMIAEEHKFGSIEEGKRANLLITKDNPLKDIKNLKNPEVVFKNGIMVDTDKY